MSTLGKISALFSLCVALSCSSSSSPQDAPDRGLQFSDGFVSLRDGAGDSDGHATGDSRGDADDGPSRDRSVDSDGLPGDGPPPDLWVGDLHDDGPPTDLGALNNGLCAEAHTLTLRPGEWITVSGTTAPFPNQYGTAIDCGLAFGVPIPMIGPQAYYRVALDEGSTYRFSLDNAYAFPRLYISDQCGATHIDPACASGVNGTVSGDEPIVYFRPPTTGSYLVVVDSTATQNAGSFDLTIENRPLPIGATCETAQPLTLVNGSVTVNHSTAESLNEFGTSIDCGFEAPLVGPQIYFRVALAAGTTYTFQLAATFGGMGYIFPAQCSDTAAINAACGTGGSGASWLLLGAAAAHDFTPAQAGEYIVAFDTFALPFKGSFGLSIAQK